MARTRSFVLMLDLHHDELILQMFQCFIAEIKKRHPNKVKTDMFDILSMILDENDTVCEQLRSDLLDIWRIELHVSAIAYDFARSLIEKFMEQLTSEELVMWGLQVSPTLEVRDNPDVDGNVSTMNTPITLPEVNNKGNDCHTAEEEYMELDSFTTEEELQSQSNASHSLHSLWNQLKVNEDEIVAALSHHDEMHKLVENYIWMVQLERRQKGIEAEASLGSL
ncbi:hypothetical protein SUGI_0204020 [Cryptomeria japonica]|nr:hypothetical protein SUGI_0204020 [Cryptomeria japonica]